MAAAHAFLAAHDFPVSDGFGRQGCGRRGSCFPPRLVSGYAVLAAAALAMTGCGSAAPHGNRPRSDVVVAINSAGVPVTEGTVNLVDEQSGEGGGGELDASGRATISGVAHGTYVVTVVPAEEVVVPTESDVGGAPPVRRRSSATGVSARFRSAQTSPLRIDVGQGGGTFEFDVLAK